MAEGFTILPNFAQEELNTKVIEQDNLPQMMLQANEQRWRMNQEAQRQNEKELNEQLSNTNFDTVGIWEVDLPEVNQDIKEFVGWIKQNPRALIKRADNIEQYQEMMQKRNDILYKIGKSKADKIIYEKQQQFINDPKNIDYQTPNNAEILNKFYLKDGVETLVDRKWNGFAPPDLWDEKAVVQYGRDKFIKTKSLNVTTDYTPDTEVMSYIGTVLNTPSLANQFMHHYKSDYDMMLNKNPNQVVEVYDQESIKKANGGSLEGNGTNMKISEITPYQLGVSNLIKGLYYVESDMKQYAPKSETSGSGNNNKYIEYEQNIPVTVSTQKPINGAKGKRVDLLSVGGWNVAGTSESPRNINIQPPNSAVDENGQLMDESMIGTSTWNVDIVGIYDMRIDESGKNFVTSDSKLGKTTKRYVKVIKKESDGTNVTYMIPFTSAISGAIKGMGITLGDMSKTDGQPITKPQNKGIYIFKDGYLVLEK